MDNFDLINNFTIIVFKSDENEFTTKYAKYA